MSLSSTATPQHEPKGINTQLCSACRYVFTSQEAPQDEWPLTNVLIQEWLDMTDLPGGRHHRSLNHLVHAANSGCWLCKRLARGLQDQREMTEQIMEEPSWYRFLRTKDDDVHDFYLVFFASTEVQDSERLDFCLDFCTLRLMEAPYDYGLEEVEAEDVQESLGTVHPVIRVPSWYLVSHSCIKISFRGQLIKGKTCCIYPNGG
jgi:hypothetical protein